MGLLTIRFQYSRIWDFSNSEDKDNEMKYILTENKGISAARNIGIKSSRGEFIALLDSDDVWKRDKLKVQLSSLKDTGFKNMVSHTDEIWIKNGVRLNPQKKHLKRGGNIFENCLKLCCVSPSSSLINKNLFSELGYFDEDLPACEDYDFWLRYSVQHEFHYVEKPLLIKMEDILISYQKNIGGWTVLEFLAWKNS